LGLAFPLGGRKGKEGKVRKIVIREKWKGRNIALPGRAKVRNQGEEDQH